MSDANGSFDEQEAIVRDTETSLVAALQESDSAVDATHDAAADAGRRTRRRMLTVAGVVLAGLGLLVARRRG
jgi:hypothetical protein